MSEPVYTIVGSDAPPEAGCASVSVWKLDAEVTEDARLGTLERWLSAPPPYLYGGRKRQCFFKSRKMRWRKG